MNWLKKALIFSAFAGLCACGVKGDPLPPDRPADLGRGRPTYKRATEKIKIENTRPAEKTPAEDDKENDDE